MTQLKIDIKFNSSCILTVQDTTGFNSTGFKVESDQTYEEGFYKVSDGYFVNALFYNKYIGEPQLINKYEEYTHIVSNNVSPIYADNFLSKPYQLKKDGVYSFKRCFFISKDYYLANQDSITKTVIYYDEEADVFTKVTLGVSETLTLREAIDALNINTTGSFKIYKFVTTCYLNKCLYLLQNQVLNNGFNACEGPADIYRKQRDFISMTLNIIKYLKEDGHLTEVQRIIEVSDSCGMICKQIGNQNDTDCGCG